MPINAGAGTGFDRNIYGAKLDGTNDWITRGSDLTGMVDGGKLTMAFKFRILSGDGTERTIISHQGTGVGWLLRLGTTNKIELYAYTSAGATLITLSTNNTFAASATTWRRVYLAYDLSVPVAYLFVEDTDETTITTLNSGTIDYTKGAYTVGARTAAGTILGPLTFDVIYADYVNYLNISTQANRRKFFSEGGNWIPKRTGNASEITGSTPILYLPQHYKAFQINYGSGGDFTVTGALEEPAFP